MRTIIKNGIESTNFHNNVTSVPAPSTSSFPLSPFALPFNAQLSGYGNSSTNTLIKAYSFESGWKNEWQQKGKRRRRERRKGSNFVSFGSVV